MDGNWTGDRGEIGLGLGQQSQPDSQIMDLSFQIDQLLEKFIRRRDDP
jgi:hypothetical protein